MSDSAKQSNHDLPDGEVLTLAETAAYLRVPEQAVLELVAGGALAAQKIGGEWRFLKRAVVEWLRFGKHANPEYRMYPPPWMLDHPYWEELFQALEKRIVGKILTAETSSAKRGSKQAVLKHFGVFQEDGDLEEQLAGIRARRAALGE